MLRHLTVTGFLVHDGRVLVHWHRRNQMWLPMGGHIEANEDPIEAVLREVEEESGVVAELIPTVASFPFDNIRQRPPPVTILLAPVRSCSVARAAGWTGAVEHIDLVYYTRPHDGIVALRTDDSTMRWLDAAALEADVPVAPEPGVAAVALADDVRVLALDALRTAREEGPNPGGILER